MRFHLNEEQVAIQEALSGALADALPREKLHAFLDAEEDFEAESWKALMALGLGGLIVPEEAGGSGLELLDAALAIESAGKGAGPGPLIGHILAGLALKLSNNAAAKERWLPKIASGETVATLALGGEWLPNNWDVEVINGKANGVVRFVQSANAAHLFLVGTSGGGLALVEAGEGASIAPIKSTDRTRRLSSVTFRNANATELFAPGDTSVQRLFDAALVLIAADALGGAQHCLDLSAQYAKEREQFGQPIGRFQALKHQLATMALAVEPARALVWYAAYAFDRNLPDASRTAALAKAHLCDRFVQVTRDAIAAHGGIGYTWEYGLNIWFRRAVFDRAYLGSPSVHRARAADMARW